ncbi:unnamed protein product [Ectocarpus sp. CCAP 1310/34]|nr:unnamed protein product [Ectocarpus sp. CCAP 1310/34]
MYKTKRLNKNMVDGGSYISIGDMYKGNKIILPDRWKGKGLSVPQIPKNAENGNFSRLEYRNEPYADMEKFSKTQPLDKRKLGFGTKDAFRPGEFTATIRTEQYRDLLRAEKNIMEKHRDPAKDQAAAQKYEKDCAEHRAFPDGLKEIEHLYDVGRSQVTEFDPKNSRDRFYTLSTGQEKRRGPYRTMAQDIGSGAWGHTYQSPEHGPIHHVKFFYDKSHLSLPQS